MTTWTERAKAHFLQERQEQADKTDETPLSSVSSVCSPPVCGKSSGVSSVSSVCSQAICAKTRNADEPHDLHRFVRKGMTRELAEHVIQLIAGRDDSDDRKSCAECRHYHGGRCAVLKFPIGHCEDIADSLHRCDGFTE